MYPLAQVARNGGRAKRPPPDVSLMSCKWLYEKQMRDPGFPNLDLSRVKCSECNKGNTENCRRKVEAIDMMKQAGFFTGGNKRKPATRNRLSYDPSSVRANFISKKAKLSDEYASPMTANKFGLGYNCKVNTPSAVGPKRKKLVSDALRVGFGQVLAEVCPNMNPEQHHRVHYDVICEDVKAAEKEAGVGKKSKDKEDIGMRVISSFVPWLKGKSPQDRRSVMAVLTEKCTRNEVIELLDENISHYEWNMAKRHFIYPGPMEPVETVKYHRRRFKTESLAGLLEFLQSGYLQGHAYGENRVKLQNGETLQTDAVSTTESNAKFLRDYLVEISREIAENEMDVPKDEERCNNKCKKNGARCLLRIGHSRKHCQFTPPGALSPSSVERILKELTKGPIKNLAGLDDEDTIKGGNNFKRLIEINEELSAKLGKTVIETKERNERLNQALLYHKTNFRKHVQASASNICQCISCGFSINASSSSSIQHANKGESTLTEKSTKTADDFRGSYCMPCSPSDDVGGLNSGNNNGCSSKEIDAQQINRLGHGVGGLQCKDEENDMPPLEHHPLFFDDNDDNEEEIDGSELEENDLRCLKLPEIKHQLKIRGLKIGKDNKSKLLERLREGIQNKVPVKHVPNETAPAPKVKTECHTEILECKYREKGHEGPCSDCEKSFQVISDLLEMARDGQKIPNLSEADLETYVELERELKGCRQNLIDWRSHIVSKKTESEFDRNEMKNLKRHEAIVVCDYKMKILNLFFRENQRKFFAKRGITCLGFMTITKSDKEDEVDVHFHLLFSNDTTQDANFVIAAKSFIYEDFLPTQFPPDTKIDVHFRADGAGCFNSNAAKSCMPLWKEWTSGKVNEKSYRISVNGDGKTSLDGIFGRLGFVLRDAVRNGQGSCDITSAETALAAYESSSGLRSTTAAIFTPIREEVLKTNETRLKQYHRLVLNEDKESIQAFHHSGYGSGVEITLESIQNHWTMEENPPLKPQYAVCTQLETIKSIEKSTHSIISKESRDKKRQENQCEMQEKALALSWNEKFQNEMRKKQFPCTHHDDSGKGYCINKFTTQAKLDAHIKSGSHSYKPQNLVDTAACMAAGVGGILMAGGRSNRSKEYCVVEVLKGLGLGVKEGTEWYGLGCYRKPARAQPQYKTEELKRDLERMFLDGEKEDGAKAKKQKYIANEALKELRSMKLVDGLRKYSSTSDYGPLPTEDQIKQYFAGLKAKQRKEKSKKLDEGVSRNIDSAVVESASPDYT